MTGDGSTSRGRKLKRKQTKTSIPVESILRKSIKAPERRNRKIKKASKKELELAKRRLDVGRETELGPESSFDQPNINEEDTEQNDGEEESQDNQVTGFESMSSSFLNDVLGMIENDNNENLS